MSNIQYVLEMAYLGANWFFKWNVALLTPSAAIQYILDSLSCEFWNTTLFGIDKNITMFWLKIVFSYTDEIWKKKIEG